MVIIEMTIQLSRAAGPFIDTADVKASIVNNKSCNVASTDLKWLKEKQLT